MTALPVNYPNQITAKLLNSQSQALEMMLSQCAMQLTVPAEAQNDRRAEGRDFSGS